MKKIIIATLVAALILFGASFALQGTAAKKAQAEHLWLMQTLLPGSESFVVVPYDGEDANIRSVHKNENGFVIETVTYGYAGEIRMYVAVTNEASVAGLVVREAHETYGLGSRILNDTEFLSQFLNQSGSFEIATHGADAFSGATAEAATEGESVSVDGISGATVSSKAVARCVSSAVAYVSGADVVSSATTWGG